VVAAFHQEMPQVKLRFITCAQEGLKRDLRKGVTDLAFLLTDAVQSSDLHVEIIGIEKLVFVAAPDHPLSKGNDLDLSMLTDQTLLLSQVDCSYRRLLMQGMSTAQIKPGKILEFNSVAAIIACARQGLGLTLIPHVAVCQEIKTKKLKVLPCSDGDFEVAQLMIWHQDKWLSPILQRFMEITRKMLMG
jgi:DNA-binding transcriptional LysR family regulator